MVISMSVIFLPALVVFFFFLIVYFFSIYGKKKYLDFFTEELKGSGELS
ncbi:MAG TPA: hypothetical protein VIO11_10785 [Candidatus Methanoperedens sp.]